ncbi:MAG: filamentous hemagglutinin N-terminal domain-containing protein [Fischerella sp. CENA71]|nr:filamentous hemagglutinin N-terminal domain-containing protein [Fischerella sp. CENA71]
MRSLFVILPLVSLGCLATVNQAIAQIIPDNSLGAENTVVNSNVKGIASDLIEGGAIRGSNLFYSFQEFNVGEGRGVYFSNPYGIANILSRVTGGNPSKILGVLGVLGNANLFLINPNGIIFGQNARLDLRGSFFGSTADSILFDNKFEFSATNPQTAPLLTVGIPIGLKFRDNSASILIQNSSLNNSFPSTFKPEQPSVLALVGGNIIFDRASLTLTGGRIELGSLALAGTVGLNSDGSLSFPNNVLRGDIRLVNGSRININAGNIAINARNLDLSGKSTLSASTSPIFETSALRGNSTNIQINATNTISVDNSILFNTVLQNTRNNTGNIELNTQNFFLTNGGQIVVNTSGLGDAGTININAVDSISINGKSKDGFSGIFSLVGQRGRGNVGDINLNTTNLSLSNGGVIAARTSGQGNGGSININVEASTSIDGDSGIFSQVGSTGIGNAGNINIKTSSLSVNNGGQISASSFGKGNAGSVTITAKDAVSVDGKTKDGQQSNTGIFSAVNSRAVGNAGGIKIVANSLSLNNGGQISASNLGNGEAGNIQVATTKDIRLDNQASIDAFTTGGQGNIDLFFRDLILRNNSKITTVAQGLVKAGNTNIDADGFVLLLKNSSIDSSAEEGFEGNIRITGTGIFVSPDSNIGNFDISNSQSTLTFEAPDVVIDATQQIAQNPCQKGSGSSFTVIGRGGLPSSPNDGFSSNETRIDLVEPVASSSSSQNSTINQPTTKPTIKQIIPAQGWIFNDKGEVVLTAYDPTTTTAQRSSKTTAACPALF